MVIGIQEMDRSVGIGEEFRWRTQNGSDELVSEIEIPRVAFSSGFEPPVIEGMEFVRFSS